MRDGRTPKTRSPYEVLLAWRELELSRSATQRAGRPGLSLCAVENAVSEIGELSGTSHGGFLPTDWHICPFISEMKAHYGLLIKVAHLVKTNSIIHACGHSILGGQAGGPAGISVSSVATILMGAVVSMGTTFGNTPTHPFYGCSTAPETVWAISAMQQAVTRNTHLMTAVMTSPVSGPMTETLLYECAAVAATTTVSGTAKVVGFRSAKGVVDMHVSGLETRFNGEIVHAAAGVSRAIANEMIKEFQKRYVHILDKDREVCGKSFLDCYDPIKVEPKPEWLDMYHRVKDEVEKIGLKMKF